MPRPKGPEKVWRITIPELQKALAIRGIQRKESTLYAYLRSGRFPRVKIFRAVYVKITGSIEEFIKKYIVSE